MLQLPIFDVKALYEIEHTFTLLNIIFSHNHNHTIVTHHKYQITLF